jgi:hypothetical protein
MTVVKKDCTGYERPSLCKTAILILEVRSIFNKPSL